MANVSDLQKKYKSLITSLHKSVECPICLDTVKTPFNLCVTGHGVCQACLGKLENCPLCQQRFTSENPVCVKNILEALPHFCLYSDAGCDQVVEQGNDHEMFCGYRPIVCRCFGCSTKVTVNQILEHHKTKHPKWLVVEEELISVTWPVNPQKEDYNDTPVFLFNNLFWVCEMNDVKEKQFKIFFIATPIGKLEHDYYAQITFEKDNFIYTYTLKASVFSSCETKFGGQREVMKLLGDQYCMKIPQDQLSHFMDDNGDLCYKYFFFRV